MKCPNCSHDNDKVAQICEVCGTLLIEPATRTKQYDDTDYEQGVPRWGNARFKDEMYLMVAVENTDAKYAFNFENITELMLGRKDPDADESPPIDLSTVGGREKGVSRKHAMIIQDEGTLSIIDNKSANGTFLNGQKLAPEQPRVLRDGDELRLGHLVIRVSFLSEQ
ncbi:MAG: FHA domain-containing protein [Chloroflexota bacterium]